MLNGGLVVEGILRVRLSDGEVVEEEHIKLDRRIHDVEVAGDSATWVITEHEDGEVLRLTPDGDE